MNLQNLRVFLKVADLEHITRAAEELNLTQPAVTKVIQSLEHEVQIALVERQGRRIVLTHAGRILQRYARQIFVLEREVEDTLTSLRDVDLGEVAIAANTTAGVYLLPPLIAHFRARYPQVVLNITILNSREIIEGTIDWTLDFGLIEGDTASLPPVLRTRVFAQDNLVLIVSPWHRWCKVAVLRPEELAPGELVLREQGSGIREVIEQELLRKGVHIRPLLTLTDNEAIKQMVINGVGAAIVSFLSVQRELASGDLVQIPLTGLDLTAQLSFIQRTDKQLSRAAQAFYNLLFPLDLK
ncbi:MAG: LysR family transcriptional regulator [Ktedonobacteraceae bacterium]